MQRNNLQLFSPTVNKLDIVHFASHVSWVCFITHRRYAIKASYRRKSEINVNLWYMWFQCQFCQQEESHFWICSPTNAPSARSWPQRTGQGFRSTSSSCFAQRKPKLRPTLNSSNKEREMVRISVTNTLWECALTASAFLPKLVWVEAPTPYACRPLPPFGAVCTIWGSFEPVYRTYTFCTDQEKYQQNIRLINEANEANLNIYKGNKLFATQVSLSLMRRFFLLNFQLMLTHLSLCAKASE